MKITLTLSLATSSLNCCSLMNETFNSFGEYPIHVLVIFLIL